MKNLKNALSKKMNYAVAAMTNFLILSANDCLASSIGSAGLSKTLGTVDWPWTRFLNSLAEELTGPVPIALGIIGIVGAGAAMFSGNSGQGTSRLITLIFAISICLFAPSLISALSSSGSGLTILGF